jgi:hypothetical protein
MEPSANRVEGEKDASQQALYSNEESRKATHLFPLFWITSTIYQSLYLRLQLSLDHCTISLGLLGPTPNGKAGGWQYVSTFEPADTVTGSLIDEPHGSHVGLPGNRRLALSCRM